MKNQKIYLEHANITVNDINQSIHFFQSAFPQFKIRGGDNESREWVHFGNDTTYVAINQAVEDLGNKFDKNYARIGINHIGFVVEDINEVANNLLDAGYKRDYPIQKEKYRIRDYFADADGNEFEFVQYLSDRVENRNSFEN